MAEALMQMYNTMTASARQELYDFALFLLTKQSQGQEKQKSAAEHFFDVADRMHGNSSGQKWTREDLHER